MSSTVYLELAFENAEDAEEFADSFSKKVPLNEMSGGCSDFNVIKCKVVEDASIASPRKLDRIIRFVTERNKEVKRSEIMRMFHVRTDDFPELLSALKERGIELK